jgi:hypothetical protein
VIKRQETYPDLPKTMKLGFNLTLEVEASIVDNGGAAGPLAEQVFYISESSPVGLLRQNDVAGEIGYARTMNALRNHALAFVITDAQGKAETKKLKAGTYYICGVLHGIGFWNVEVELKAGKNSLAFNNENMTAKQKM